jgi:hypothetical protein
MPNRSKRDRLRDVYDTLDRAGLFDFGAVIPRGMVYDLLGLDVPEVASKAVFDRIAMLELQAMDYCRNMLLGHGKYLAGTPSGYRVLLPSENKAQVDAYMESADRKLERALKLSRNSPKASHLPDQTEARIMMRRNGYRHGAGAEQPGAAL